MPESISSMIGTVLEIYGPAFPVGLVIAVSGALFGVFVVLKRVVFIGVTLSEAAACGIALGLLLGWHPFLGALLTAMIVVVMLGLPFERWLKLPRDTLLGVLFVAFSAGAVVLVAKSGFGLEKVKNLLFGSLLFASNQDLFVITAVLAPCTLWLLVSIRPTTYAFLDPDAASVLGIKVKTMELAFFVTLGAVVAAASKIAGVLLIFCYLVVAPGAALLLHHRLGGVLLLSATVAATATIGGILVSYRFDLPPNQTVALVHCLIFLLAVIGHSRLPVVSLGRGIPVTVLGTTLILFLLLSLPMAIQGQAPESASGAEFQVPHAVPPAVSPPFASPGGGSEGVNGPRPADWGSRVTRLRGMMEEAGKSAVPEAMDFLAQDPPLLYRSQILAGIEAVLNASSGWNIRLPASDERNKDAASRIRKLLKSTPESEGTGIDWQSKAEIVRVSLQSKGRIAVPEGLAFLRRDPPTPFRALVVEAIERELATSTGWIVQKPAGSPENIQAFARCTELLPFSGDADH